MLVWFLERPFASFFLLAYLAFLGVNALASRREASEIAGYYVANRRLGGVAVGLSFFATFASTNSYIGHAGKGYEYGLPWMTMAFMLILFTLLSWKIVGPKTRELAASFDALTMPDFLAGRFNNDRSTGLLKISSAIVIVLCSFLYLVAIFKGVGHLFSNFFGLSYEQSIFLALAVVVAYTSIGGFLSVVRTDMLQGCMMIIGAMMMFFFVTRASGGVGSIFELAEREETSFIFDLNGGIPFFVLLGIALSGSLKLLVDPRQLTRFYALRDARAVKTALWISLLGLTVVQLCLYPIGIYAHFLIVDVTDTDLIVPTLLTSGTVFPSWAADFLFVSILAAAMSSIDSVLLVSASTFYKNIVAPYVLDSKPVFWTRAAVVLMAVMAAIFSINPPGDIIEITIFSGSLYAVCFFPAVVLGLHWSRGSSLAVLWSMVLGVSTLFAWLLLDFKETLHEVFPALLVSLTAYVICSMMSNDNNSDIEVSSQSNSA